MKKIDKYIYKINKNHKYANKMGKQESIGTLHSIGIVGQVHNVTNQLIERITYRLRKKAE